MRCQCYVTAGGNQSPGHVYEFQVLLAEDCRGSQNESVHPQTQFFQAFKRVEHINL